MTKYKFLCADIGTTSLKAALVSEMGQVLSFSRINFEHAEKFKISNECALAKAIIGHKIGDVVAVKANTPYEVTILSCSAKSKKN